MVTVLVSRTHLTAISAPIRGWGDSHRGWGVGQIRSPATLEHSGLEEENMVTFPS